MTSRIKSPRHRSRVPTASPIRRPTLPSYWTRGAGEPRATSIGPVQHTPTYAKVAQSGLTVSRLESVLADWFEAEVVLTSSGRSAILLYLSVAGLNRYEHRVAIPRTVSACVLDAIIRRAFPVDAASAQNVDLTILYHQYGIPQQFRAETHTLEDICHAFFASECTGARSWAGPAAVFSLPKFFQTSSMIGGIVTRDRSLADRIRGVRVEAPELPKETRSQHAKCLQRNTGGSDLEEVYLARLLNPRIEDDEIAGAPSSIEEIKHIAGKRRQNLERLLAAVRTSAVGAEWPSLLLSALSFACPVFGDPVQLAETSARLKSAGIVAGLYRIDRARNMAKPDYQTAVLLPCHHAIPEHKIDEMGDVLRTTLR